MQSTTRSLCIPLPGCCRGSGGDQWGWRGVLSDFLGEDLALAEADGCCGGSRVQRALMKPGCTRPSVPKHTSQPFSKSISHVFACETAPLLCQQLEGISLPGPPFQDGGPCVPISRMYMFSAFVYRRRLGEPFHPRGEVLQAAGLPRRLVRLGGHTAWVQLVAHRATCQAAALGAGRWRRRGRGDDCSLLLSGDAFAVCLS